MMCIKRHFDVSRLDVSEGEVAKIRFAEAVRFELIDPTASDAHD